MDINVIGGISAVYFFLNFFGKSMCERSPFAAKGGPFAAKGEAKGGAKGAFAQNCIAPLVFRFGLKIGMEHHLQT